MPTGVYPRDKNLLNLFQKGQKPWNTGLRYKGDPRPELKGKQFGTPFLKGQVAWNKKEQLHITCKNCGVIFQGLASAKKKFCSNTCYWNHKESFIREKKGVVKECLICKLGFYITPSSKRKYCSAKCYWQGLKKFETKKEAKRFHAIKRRMIKLNVAGTHSLEEWLKIKRIYKYTCPMCMRKEPEIILTEDHIIALTRGGNNFIDNIQPLCKSCNSKKGNKLSNFGIPNVKWFLQQKDV